MEGIQTPIVPKAPQANWHLAITGDRRTYAPTDGPSTSFDYSHEPMPAMPALYADITTDIGAEAMSHPNNSFLPRQNSDATKPGSRRNFSRKGRAERNGIEHLNENELEEEATMSNNIRQSGWVPSGLRTRSSPSPHSAPRVPDRRLESSNGTPAQRYHMGDQRSEEVCIAYNPNATSNIGFHGPPRVVGIGRQPAPVMDPDTSWI